MPRNVLCFVAPLFLLSACASAPQAPADLTKEEGVDSRSAYGLYLAGEAALKDGAAHDAARLFDRAEQMGGADQIGERAFMAALLAGDVGRAATLAPKDDEATPGGKRLGRLTVAVESMATGKADVARAMLSADDSGAPQTAASALLAPWAAALAGDTEGSIVRPEAGDDRVVAYFGQLGQATLFERAKRYSEAETDFKLLTDGESAGDIVVLSYGAFLERRDRRPEAVKLYDATLASDPNNTAIRTARARAAAGRPAPPTPTLRQGAAQALLAPAASLIAAKQQQLGLAYLRLVLRLDPQRDEAWLLVGDVMSEAGDLAAARDAYQRPAPGSDQYAAARAKLAWSYQGADEPEVALKMAREAAASGGYEARLTLADLLRAQKNYAESSVLLTGLIAEAPNPDWRLYYARGVAYEQLGRWPDAEADLLAALKIEPDEPELLNYLGYSWIDRGERLPQAMAMVEKAVAANPKSGAMVDSLGWAYYRQGDYRTAVDKLEAAVELDAGDPEINDHLGDAYWRVGRRAEAGFQWRRVLTLEPDDKMKARAEAKIASGLPPTASAPAKVAGQ